MSARVVLLEVIVIGEDLPLLLLLVKMGTCVVQDLFIQPVLILKNVPKETIVSRESKLHVLPVLTMLKQELLRLQTVFHVNMVIIVQTPFPLKSLARKGILVLKGSQLNLVKWHVRLATIVQAEASKESNVHQARSKTIQGRLLARIVLKETFAMDWH
jgi:hypothetical protein